MLKWGSKMRPPFLDDLRKETWEGRRQRRAHQRVLRLSSTGGIGGFVPVKKHARSSLDGRRRISVPCPHDPCRAESVHAVPCLVPRSCTKILVPRSWYQARHGTEIFGTARIMRARHGNPPPPVKGGTGVFFNRHGTPKSPVLERL